MQIKKSAFILLAIIGAFVAGVFALNTELAKTYLRKHDRHYQREVSCFTIMPYKCGHIDGTDEEILWQIRRLQLTKEEAQNLILESQRENINTLRDWEMKGDLTADEQSFKPLKERVVGYHDRVLHILDETSFYWDTRIDYERDRHCFIETPDKCGPGYDATDKELSFEVYWLGPGKIATQESALKAQGDERRKIEEIMRKESLTETEKRNIEESRKLQDYYTRILRVMDRME